MNRFSQLGSLFACVLVLLSSCAADDQHVEEVVETGKFEVPEVQMAIVQMGNGGPEVLHYQQIPVLQPREGEVLVKIVAAAINPIDRRSREGGGPRPDGPGGPGGRPPGGPPGGAPQRPPGDPATPNVPGGDFAGIVVKLGAGVTDLQVGDAVFSKIALGERDRLNGAYSEYAVTRADHTHLKPLDQTFAEAAGLATVGATALRTIKHAKVTAGQRVFINGIGGGIGSSAAQFSLQRGAYVIGTASGRHHAYLASIGVDEAINYREVQFDEVVKEPVDVVIETVSTATANQALNILKPGGKLVSIAGAADPALCVQKGVECSRIGGEFGWPNTVILAEVAQLAMDGHYRLNVDETFPLQEAGAAQDRNFSIGTAGKIVLVVDAELANKRAKRDSVVLVTGITGNQGGGVAATMLEEGYRVRGLTRDPGSERAQYWSALGVEMVKGDFTDYPSIEAAAEGIDFLFVNLQERIPNYVEASKHLLDVAHNAGAKHIVFSSNRRSEPELPESASKTELEKYLRGSGYSYTTLRMPQQMSNFMRERDMQNVLRSGVVGRGMEGATFAYFAPDNLGVIAAASFADPMAWNRREVNLAGDELTDADLAALLSELSGLEIEYTSPTEEPDARWLANQNLTYDTVELKQEFPGIMTLREFLEQNDYGQKLKAMSLLPLPPPPSEDERRGGGPPQRQ